MQPLFAVADPSKAGELMKKYRFIIFPEDKFDDISYHKKAEAMFEKFKATHLMGKIVQ